MHSIRFRGSFDLLMHRFPFNLRMYGLDFIMSGFLDFVTIVEILLIKLDFGSVDVSENLLYQ